MRGGRRGRAGRGREGGSHVSLALPAPHGFGRVGGAALGGRPGSPDRSCAESEGEDPGARPCGGGDAHRAARSSRRGPEPRQRVDHRSGGRDCVAEAALCGHFLRPMHAWPGRGRGCQRDAAGRGARGRARLRRLTRGAGRLGGVVPLSRRGRQHRYGGAARREGAWEGRWLLPGGACGQRDET